MRKLFLFILVVVLVALLSACGDRLQSVINPEISPTPSASPYQQNIQGGEETSSPEETPAPPGFQH